LPFVIASTYLIVPLVETPVVGGGVTGRAVSPDTEYSQMSPALPPMLVALGTGEAATELADGSGVCGGLGI
jgi:hypothetical protein